MGNITNKYTKEEIEIENRDVFNFANGKYSKLKDAIEKDRLIVFWGAGVSQLAGCEGWENLTKKIIKYLTPDVFSYSEAKSLHQECSKDLRKVITICRSYANSTGNESIFNKAIEDSVKPKNEELFKEVHELILEIGAYAYVTTNIDKGIETAKDKFKENQKIYDLTQTIPARIIELVRNGNIFYLHGSIDNIQRSIFSNDNYYDFYNQKNLIELLENIFSGRYTVLFIGYGLGDYEILNNIFLSVKKRANTRDFLHFVLTPLFSNESNTYLIEEKYLEIYSICPIYYYIDYSDYQILKDVLKKFTEIANSIKTPKISKIDLINSIP